MKKPTNYSIGSLLAFAAGGYVLWANRFRIQRFLEAQGIKTPWLTSNAGEALRSGAAKLSGSFDNATGTGMSQTQSPTI